MALAILGMRPIYPGAPPRVNTKTVAVPGLPGPFAAVTGALFLLTGWGRHHFAPCATTRIASRSMVALVRIRMPLLDPLIAIGTPQGHSRN